MKNKNNLRNILIICSIIIVGFIVKSRIYPRNAFDFLVLNRMVEVKENCVKMQREILKYKTDSINNVTNSTSRNTEISNEYETKHGDCMLDDNKLKLKIEKDIEKELNDEWKFVY